jgi:tetratricopeptide (TPR) repeat protein
MQLADLFMKSGQVKNTIAVLKKVNAIAPDYSEAWIKLGEVHLMFKQYQDVFNYSNKALENDPYNDKAYFLKAYAYKEMGDTNNAINSFQQCVKFNTKHYEANIELGLMFMSLKNPLAISYFNNAIAIDSNKIDAYYDLGMYYQENDELNEAIATYKKLSEVDPKFPSSYYNIGYIYLELLNISDMSIPYFTKAIAANPQYFEAYYNRGLAFEKLGNVFNAQNDYKYALQLNPNYEKAIIALNRVQEGDNK